MRAAAAAAAAAGGCWRGQIGLRVTGDDAIRQINRRHLGHDYPTDVISFPYRREPPEVEGELVVSWETAEREAARLAGEMLTAGWGAAEELLLYTIHGVLHLVGYDDVEEASRRRMREAERAVLARLGIALPPPAGPDAVVAPDAVAGPDAAVGPDAVGGTDAVVGPDRPSAALPPGGRRR